MTLPNVLPTPIFNVAPARIVVGRPASVTLTITDETGAPADADADPTYQITDGAGGQLATGGTGTASHDGTGLYSVPIPDQVHPDQLTVTWTATLSGQAGQAAQLVNVLGQRLIDVPTLVADPKLKNYTAAQLLPVIAAVEDRFDQVLGFPCVPRGERVEFWVTSQGYIDTFPTVTGLPYGAGAPRVLVPNIERPIYVVDAERWFEPLSDLALIKVGHAGALEYADGRPWPPGPYRLWIVHGFNPPPEDLRAAAALLVRYKAQRSDTPENAATVTSAGSTVVFSLPTPDRPTGVPQVDTVLNSYRAGGPGGAVVI